MTMESGATMEVFRRYRGISDPAYTDRISLFAGAATPGYQLSASTGAVFEALNQNPLPLGPGQPKVAVHGLVYARTNDVTVDGTTGGAMFQNGLVARDLNIAPTPGADPLLVNVRGSNDAQDVVLTATATSPGEAPVTSTVHGQLQADNTGTDVSKFSVESWRTG